MKPFAGERAIQNRTETAASGSAPALPPVRAAAQQAAQRGSGRGATRYYAADPTQIRLSVSAVVWRSAPGRDGELLLMRRSDNVHWGLPGGYVEPGESVTAAAVREVLEETGVHIEVGRLVGVYSEPSFQVIAYPDGTRVQAVNLCFEARPVGQGQALTPEETLATGYFAASALPEPFVPIHRVRLEDAISGEAPARVR